jgi:hypothetical protein
MNETTASLTKPHGHLRKSCSPAGLRLVLAHLLAATALTVAAAPADPAPGTRQPAAATASKSVKPARTAKASEGPSWSELSPAQRKSLAPLAQDWSGMDSISKEKWMALAAHFPTMPARERERIQNRMTEWSRLAPSERGQARLRFQQTRSLTAEERRARWEAYKNLPPEQREKLNQTALDSKAAQRQAAAVRGTPRAGKPAAGAEASGAPVKSNIVPHPSRESQALRQVTPGVVRDGHGGTTTLVSRRPQPPAHLQPGMPKIAATAPFVDPDTLLPRRGAQAAAVRGPASNAGSRQE